MFEPGKSGNAKGKTVEDRQRDQALAVKAREIAGEWLESIHVAIKEAPTAEAKLTTLRPDTLRLVEGVQDRAWGKAKQAIDVESPDGSMTPREIRLVAVKSRVDDTGD